MIAVSFLKSKYDRQTTIKLIDDSICELIHVDLMDGIYVDTKNFIIEEIIEDLKSTTKLLDIHLMCQEPLLYIKQLINLNVWGITIHLGSSKNISEIIEFLKNKHIKVGIALNPNENINLLNNYLEQIDYVLIMSVYPGKGGQNFIPEVLDKVKYLENKNVLIGIDGGINKDTIHYLKGYRIDNIISGSYVCLSDDYNKAIEDLKKELN